MRNILGQRPLRFVFAASVISMLGSGMNSAAVKTSIGNRQLKIDNQILSLSPW
jgi:hypothetical protein